MPTKRPEYYIENGLRKVRPYLYQYQTFTKHRWIGKTLLEVFKSEFKAKPINYYEQEILKGIIKVNGSLIDLNYRCKNKDSIESLIHQHERSVCNTPIEIIEETDDLLVVNKPGSLPVHPTARYNYNTLTQILKFEHNFGDLHCINRIDRLTSGIVMLSKTSEKAAEMTNLMQQKSIKKAYLARVKGRFPFDEIICNEPIAPLVHKAGRIGVCADGKPCSTNFTFLSFNGRTSLLKCEPLTGRTHQIRVHLQHLGYPIANDPMYGLLEWQTKEKHWMIDDKHEIMPPFEVNIGNETTLSCLECANPTRDPIPEQLQIWLHAFEYKSKDWCYQTRCPEWAQEGFLGDLDIESRFWMNKGLWDGQSPKVYL